MLNGECRMPKLSWLFSIDDLLRPARYSRSKKTRLIAQLDVSTG
jgi:hypothetical protein